MIDVLSYTAEEMDILYSAVEDAVKNKTHIDMIKVVRTIRPGDLYLWGEGTNGLYFAFNGLKWVEENDIYYVLIQLQISHGYYTPQWYPVFANSENNFYGQGKLSMIKKENRYINTNLDWINNLNRGDKNV
ncbi:MAG: hypothetical protein IJ661_10185 [Lachnospiraceae bacterium]|nr:hypothetical protein [Lachnospiraceae bacterium]